jgi:hypothetical protein
MRKELVVALVAGIFVLVGMSAGEAQVGTTQDSSTSSIRPAASVAPNADVLAEQAAALAERAALLNEQAAVQHAKTVDLRNRVEANSRAYEQRMQRELGDRAPRETISPMETIAPPETPSPFDD